MSGFGLVSGRKAICGAGFGVQPVIDVPVVSLKKRTVKELMGLAREEFWV